MSPPSRPPGEPQEAWHDATPATRALDFPLRGDFITLDALIKASGLAGSGGMAKSMIQAGEVRVDGHVEQRRGRKLRGGEIVQAAGRSLRVLPAGA